MQTQSSGLDHLEESLHAGQNADNLDSLFAGKMLGHKSDIADGSLRAWEFRKFGNLVGDYCVSPRFLDAVTVSMVLAYKSWNSEKVFPYQFCKF